MTAASVFGLSSFKNERSPSMPDGSNVLKEAMWEFHYCQVLKKTKKKKKDVVLSGYYFCSTATDIYIDATRSLSVQALSVVHKAGQGAPPCQSLCCTGAATASVLARTGTASENLLQKNANASLNHVGYEASQRVGFSFQDCSGVAFPVGRQSVTDQHPTRGLC